MLLFNPDFMCLIPIFDIDIFEISIKICIDMQREKKIHRCKKIYSKEKMRHFYVIASMIEGINMNLVTRLISPEKIIKNEAILAI